MILFARFLAVLLVLALTGAAIAGLIALRRSTPVKPPGDLRPVVRVAAPERTVIRLDVEATGTVLAYGQLTLAAEVAGRIEAITPGLDAGVRVAADQELLRTETVDLAAALARAQADLATAQLSVAQEEALAAEARRDLALLVTDPDSAAPETAPSALAQRQLQVAAAQARVAAQQAAVAQATRDLARSTVRAPTAAIIEERLVEAGQLVTRGQALLRLRAADVVEAHLPITVEDLALLTLPTTADDPAPMVELRTSDGRQATGTALRITGALDASTRLATLVVRIAAPTSLLPGDFVQARIVGAQTVTGITLPRHLLRRDGSILLVDGEARLIEHPAHVLRLRRDDAVISDDLPAGSRLVLNRLDAWSTGSAVRIATDVDTP